MAQTCGMLALTALTMLVASSQARFQFPPQDVAMPTCGNQIHFPEETHLSNVKQLTFGGQNAEAYFSFDNTKLIFQSTAAYGTKCDQIFEFDWTKDQVPRMVSTGLGTTTCSYFFADNKHMLYASTHESSQQCQPKLCSPTNEINATVEHICTSLPFNYTWDIFPEFDIYKTNQQGVIVQKLTDDLGFYDAEATISPDGKTIVYTSTAGGDLDLWTMNVNGSNKFQVTDKLGYDGGAYFSPDSKRLVFRASRPNSTAEIELYNDLLHNWGIVSPIYMELFTINADGTDMKQVSELGMANWAPFWHPSGEKIIFSSNHGTAGFNFNLWLVDDDGNNLEKITYDPIFDAFPMFSFDGKKLVFISNRNCSDPGDFNIFIADYDSPSTKGASGTFASIQTVMTFVFVIVAAFANARA
jgi:TolB protein